MDIDNLFKLAVNQKRRIHLIGIGGVSMSALAGVLLSRGVPVSGSDRSSAPILDKLSQQGAVISIGHKAENVSGAAIVIRTAAIHDDNPEVIGAREQAIPVISRAEGWGILMKDYQRSLCIAGTHGKTTTSSMAVHVALAAGLDPTVMIGGSLPVLGGSYRIGGNDLFIAESCEYCNSYHHFSPTTAVILNVDRDHIDFFPSLAATVDSFRTFALRTPEKDGLVIVSKDDENAMRAVSGISRRIITFGMNASADVYPGKLTLKQGYYSFDVMIRGRLYASVSLQVPGLHNVANCLAVAAAAGTDGIPGEAFSRGINSFTGVGRRFEHMGEWGGAVISDDYAHHPSEIAATLKTARTMGFSRVICVFQPHTYSRTLALFDDFVRVLSLADLTVFAEVYAAREHNDTGFSSSLLADRLENSVFFPGFEEIVSFLRQTLRPGDLCLTMGAGNIRTVAETLLSIPSPPLGPVLL